DGMDHGEAYREVIAGDDGERSGVPLSKTARRRLDLGRPQVARGRVDGVAPLPHPRDVGLDPSLGGVGWQDQPGWLVASVRLVAAEAVGPEPPGDCGDLRGFDLVGKGVAPRRQARRELPNQQCRRAARIAVLAITRAKDDARDRAILSRQED